MRVSDHSEPEPDLTLVRARPDFYAAAHPQPEDVLLAVEVADSSLRYDKFVKVPMYARAGIVEVWIVDVDEGRIEVYRQPTSQAPREYAEVRVFGRGERLAPQALPDLEVAVEGIVG